MSDKLQQNVENNLKSNPYPGRGIVIGANASGNKLVQVYWIMGRSDNSRNRVFVQEGNTISTGPFDASKVEDPSLIIYNAVRNFGNMHIVSNGDQTDTVYKEIQSGGTFESALGTRTFEPDAPNYTPRVSGIIYFDKDSPSFKLNILKAVDNNPDTPENHTWTFGKFTSGAGFCFHTYREDGNPLPPFSGEPYEVPLAETPDEILACFWQALNIDNRISLVVKTLDATSGDMEFRIMNKNR